MIHKKSYLLKEARYYELPRGEHFFTIKNNVPQCIEYCREEFSYYFNEKNKFIGYTKKILNIEKINEFFELIENILKLKEKTVFFKVKEKNEIVIIKVSDFWLKNEMNRQFFTLFLRVGATFYKKSLRNSFLKYELSKEIFPAIEYFLNGFTECKDSDIISENYIGVVDYFRSENYKFCLFKPIADKINLKQIWA